MHTPSSSSFAHPELRDAFACVPFWSGTAYRSLLHTCFASVAERSRELAKPLRVLLLHVAAEFHPFLRRQIEKAPYISNVDPPQIALSQNDTRRLCLGFLALPLLLIPPRPLLCHLNYLAADFRRQAL